VTTAADLARILDLKPVGTDRFLGYSPANGWRRVFGGQALAQALVAAERTVVGRLPHSLHAYFILAGDPEEPIAYEVERVRDGRSFTTRQVVARQHGDAIFAMLASFHIAETGPEHAIARPAAPSPEDSFDFERAAEALPPRRGEQIRGLLERIRPIEFRPTDVRRYLTGDAGGALKPSQTLWIRIRPSLPDDPAIQRAALVYLSDMTLLDASLAAHGHTISDGSHQVASLDHALWLHRPARADEWLLYVQDSPNADGARGLTRGLLYALDGRLIASVAQEGLIRPRAP